jgi:hypothetical protein
MQYYEYDDFLLGNGILKATGASNKRVGDSDSEDVENVRRCQFMQSPDDQRARFYNNLVFEHSPLEQRADFFCALDEFERVVQAKLLFDRLQYRMFFVL